MLNKKITVLVINHALAIPAFRRRWEKLAENENFEVHIILPSYLEQFYFGEKVVYINKNMRKGSFHIHALKLSHPSNYGSSKFLNLKQELLKIDADFVYLIGNEGIDYLQQAIKGVKKIIPKAKIAFFTMNAKPLNYKKAKNPFSYLRGWKKFQRIKNNCDIAIGHYPGCLENLRREGFEKPIYLQTQVGVDEALFVPNEVYRTAIRKELDWESNFIIGFCGRLKSIKGVDTLVDSFLNIRKTNTQTRLLLVGNGELKEKILEKFKKLDILESIHITDFIDQEKVPQYMNAMDVLILGSKTTKNWIDTFPLVTVQAQASGVPVIASNSSSIPWQLGDSALLFSEGNDKDLSVKIQKIIDNSQLRNELIQKGRSRSLAFFCHEGMTNNFIEIVKQTLDNKPKFHEKGESYNQHKAY